MHACSIPDGRGLLNHGSLNSLGLVVSHNDFEVPLIMKSPGGFFKAFYYLMSETSPTFRH